MTWWILAIWAISGIISVPLVVFFLIYLGINKQFNYSFYRLVQCDLLLNLLTYTSTWIKRLSDLEITKPYMVYVFENFEFIYYSTGFLPYFFFNVQSLSSITLCIHRCSTATFQNANQFWTKYYLAVYFGICLFSTALILPQCLLGHFTYFIYDKQKNLFVKKPSDYAQIGWTFLSYQNRFYYCCIIFFGLLTVVVLRCRTVSVDQNPRSKMLMRKLAQIAFINNFVYLGVVVWQNVAFMFSADLSVEMNTFWLMVASDVLSLSMPYILILCDSNVKTAINKKIGRSNSQSSGGAVFIKTRDGSNFRTTIEPSRFIMSTL